MSRTRPIVLLAAALLSAGGGEAARAAAPVTPAGWAVRPAGRQIAVSPLESGFQGPMGTALSPDGTRLLAASSSAARFDSVDLFDLRRGLRTASVPFDAASGRGVFYGVAFSPDGHTAWASGGGEDVVHVFAVGSGLTETGQIPAPYFPAGIAYGNTPRGPRLYVANNLSGPAGATNPPGHQVTVIDPATQQVTGQIDLGMPLEPLGVAFERHSRKAYVTDWLGRSVSVIDTGTESVVRRVVLSPRTRPLQADHPGAIVANPVRDEVYTANANSDTVSVLDTAHFDRVAATIRVSLARGAAPGAMPDGLAVSPNGRTLYVALAGENAIAVVDVRRRGILGYIPTAWFPTDVEATPDGRSVVVTAANAAGAHPRTCVPGAPDLGCPSDDPDDPEEAPSAGSSTKGSVSVIRLPRTRRGVRRLSARVRANNHALRPPAAMPHRLKAITHVIYVIKENRTYDQVLGDIGKGDGAPALTLFHDDAAPNQREFARRFTLFDRFFADGDVSANGHSWTDAAGVTDYVERTWPITYSPQTRHSQRARDFEDLPFAQQFPTEPLAPGSGVRRPAAAPTSGYLWDNAYRHHVSYRDYGEFTRVPADCDGPGNVSRVTHLREGAFGDHVDELYPGFNLACSDHSQREPEWEREFAERVARQQADPAQNALPRLEIVRLPNDHTFGTRAGRATPQSYVADNDQALGRLVDVVSHSPFWKSTAIFVTEDDAQNGPDHVDAHRTLGYVISPYTRTGRVDSTHYDTASMVGTLEDLLGLPPMTIFDQRATRMWAAFGAHADLTPYTGLTPFVRPFGEPDAPVNTRSAPLAKASARWDFEDADATPELGLDQAIWKSVRGARSEMPAPRHTRIVGSQPATGP